MKNYFRENIINLAGYTSPPQKNFKVKLNQNESPFDVPPHIKSELLKEFAETEWQRYPVNESPQLREKLAEWHGVDASQIILGNGSNQLLQTLLTASIDVGETVLYTPPSFSLFDLFSYIYGAKVKDVLWQPGQNFPIDDVLKAIKETNPKVTLLCSPNNPTGGEISFGDVEKVCQTATGIVFLDEAYAEFSGKTGVPLLKKYPNLVISRTFSKAFSMAGLRFGYFIANTNFIEQFRKVNLPYNINLFTECVALKLLDERETMEKQVKFLVDQREKMFAAMQEIDIIITYPSAANFILFGCADGKKMFNDLADLGVLVRDMGSYPLCQNHHRVSVGSEHENEMFINALRSIKG